MIKNMSNREMKDLLVKSHIHINKKSHNLYKYVFNISDISMAGDHMTLWIPSVYDLGFRYVFFNDILWNLTKDYNAYQTKYNLVKNTEDEILKFIISELRIKKLERIIK